MNTNPEPALEQPLPQFPSPVPQDEWRLEQAEGLRFYLEWRKVYKVAHHLFIQRQRMQVQEVALLQRVQAVEKQMGVVRQEQRKEEWGQIREEKRRVRQRRRAEEIEKKYICEMACCGRSYGSEGSLQQHMKLKHVSQYLRLQREGQYRMRT